MLEGERRYLKSLVVFWARYVIMYILLGTQSLNFRGARLVGSMNHLTYLNKVAVSFRRNISKFRLRESRRADERALFESYEITKAPLCLGVIALQFTDECHTCAGERPLSQYLSSTKVSGSRSQFSTKRLRMVFVQWFSPFLACIRRSSLSLMLSSIFLYCTTRFHLLWPFVYSQLNLLLPLPPESAKAHINTSSFFPRLERLRHAK
jgi:hypothetical protein